MFEVLSQLLSVAPRCTATLVRILSIVSVARTLQHSFDSIVMKRSRGDAEAGLSSDVVDGSDERKSVKNGDGVAVPIGSAGVDVSDDAEASDPGDDDDETER